MSKLYDKYLEYKKSDSSLFYLFKCDSFYIFLGDDADYISKITTLKKTFFCKNCFKCGFPLKSLDIYMNIFNELGINIKIINDSDNGLIDRLNSIDINKINGIEALIILKELKELI